MSSIPIIDLNMELKRRTIYLALSHRVLEPQGDYMITSELPIEEWGAQLHADETTFVEGNPSLLVLLEVKAFQHWPEFMADFSRLVQRGLWLAKDRAVLAHRGGEPFSNRTFAVDLLGAYDDPVVPPERGKNRSISNRVKVCMLTATVPVLEAAAQGAADVHWNYIRTQTREKEAGFILPNKYKVYKIRQGCKEGFCSHTAPLKSERYWTILWVALIDESFTSSHTGRVR